MATCTERSRSTAATLVLPLQENHKVQAFRTGAAQSVLILNIKLLIFTEFVILQLLY
jgi:hypothetical protein